MVISKPRTVVRGFFIGARRFVDVNENAERIFLLDRARLLETGPIDLSPPVPVHQPCGDPVQPGEAVPAVVAVPGVDPGGNHCGHHPPDPVSFSRRRRRVDDPLHMRGLDVLAGNRVDDLGGEPLAQAPLQVRMLPGPPLGHRKTVRVQE